MNKKILISFFLLISIYRRSSAQFSLGGFSSSSTTPSIDYSYPKEYEIGGISVDGVQFLDPNALIALTNLKVGDKISVPGDDISEAIKKLWNQGILSDVEIYATKIENDKIFLEIFLKERPRLSRFYFEGISKSDADNIKEKMSLIKGKVVTDVLLKNAQLSVRKYFVDKGFLNVQIAITQEIDSSLSNYSSLRIKIVKNNKIKINRIYFEGNSSFSARVLKSKLKETHERLRFTIPNDLTRRLYRIRYFRFDPFLRDLNALLSPKHITNYLTEHVRLNIFSSSKLEKAKFEEDKQQLVRFYQTKGYRDISILSDSLYEHDKRSINILLRVEEGKKYYFRNIYWKGNYVYNEQVLSRTLAIKKGDIYNAEELEKKLSFNPEGSDVKSLYMDDGYLFFNIEPVEVNVEGDSIDIEMRIEEGVQADINKIIVTGNTKTSDRVILREIRTIPGQKFNRSLLIRTQRELSVLGYFDPEKMDMRPVPDMKTGKVDIEYDLVEKPNDQIELSAGWSGVNIGFFGTVGLVFNNFSIRKIPKLKQWKPLPGGDGQRLALRVQANGPQYQTYSASFTEPWLGGKKPHALSTAFTYTVLRQYNGDQTLGIFKIAEISTSLARRLKFPDDFFVLSNSFSFKQYSVVNDQTRNFGFTDGVANNFNFNTTISRNSIDNPLYPRHGASLSASFSFTPPYSYLGIKSGKDFLVEYHKTMIDISFFTNLVGNLVLNTRAHLGFLGRYNPNLSVSRFERFDVGGSGLIQSNFLLGTDVIGLRGYEDKSLDPFNPRSLTDPLANRYQPGVAYNKYVFELRYPITLNPTASIYALAFAEGANNWNSSKEFNPFKLYRAVGVGVRLFLPALGLLGIDYGYGLDAIPGRPGDNRRGIMFVIGQQLR